ncbi:hypothetical protein AgCh_017755 [Apium graveolens]
MGYDKIVSENIVIDDVVLVASLEVNLLSVSQFADKGFEVLFNKEECTFITKKTGEVALKGARKGAYLLQTLTQQIQMEFVASTPRHQKNKASFGIRNCLT